MFWLLLLRGCLDSSIPLLRPGPVSLDTTRIYQTTPATPTTATASAATATTATTSAVKKEEKLGPLKGPKGLA